MEKQLTGKNLAFVGLTLFSMFFGAGNLIFPPYLGAQAGAFTWFAMAGFAVSAIGLPILGVIAVARSGGLAALAGRVHPVFASVFTLLIYLSIGPCLAIPRTASTSYEMAVRPFLDAGWPVQLGYSVLFFAVALFLALRPDKLTDRLGRILCPSLLVLIVVLFAGSFLFPVDHYGTVSSNYVSNPSIQGFLDGYQTMDTIAALNFGAVIAINIRAKGVNGEWEVRRGTVRAGWIAGATLLVVYGMLVHIGALSGYAFPGSANGAEVLTRLVSTFFGPVGSIVLALVFLIACLNTCVGLISCCSTYFHGLMPRFTYRFWACLFSAVSLIISNAGLDQILKISIPILHALYPVAIVLIVLALLQHWIGELRLVYPVAISFTGVVSVLYAGKDAGLRLPLLSGLLDLVPLSSVSLGWILPAVLGICLGLLLSLPRGRS